MLKKAKKIDIPYSLILNFEIAVTVILSSLFPLIFSLQILDEFKPFNGLDILLQKGINFKYLETDFFINFPSSLKFAIFFNIIFIILGSLFFFLKKYIVSAVFNLFSAMSIFIFIISLGELKNTITNCNISSNYIFLNILWPYLICIFLEIFSSVFSILKKGVEYLAESIFFCCCFISIAIVISFFFYIAIYGLPVIFKIGFFKFVFNSNWSPTTKNFGILNLLLSSIVVTLGATILAAPIGVLAATYLSEIAHKKIAIIANTTIEVLAAIPSVIYGLFGMTTIVPAIKSIFTNKENAIVGDSLLAAILVLFIMILPTIISISYTTIKNTNPSYKEASLNLGATKTQTIFKVTIKASKTGIFSAITLAIARAIGETMAVIMVAGNVVNPPSFLKPVRLLTTGIAIDISYSSGILREVLFGIGFILFILIIIINILFKAIFKKKIKEING